MIKKLLTMSAGIVLGSMIATASFANDYEASDVCLDMRAAQLAVIDMIQECKDADPVCDNLDKLRACKQACNQARRDICPDGDENDANPDDIAACFDCLVVGEP